MVNAPQLTSVRKQLRNSRSGQALVEFAIIAFVMSAMIAGLLGIMVMALGSFQNNIAAEGAGRILNEKLPAGLADAQQVYDALESQGFYDEANLVLTSSQYYDSNFKKDLPQINRMLLSHFVYDHDRDVFRYPGAVVTNSSGELTVLIPLLPKPSLGATNGIDRTNSADLSNSYPVANNWVAPVTVTRVDAPTTDVRQCCAITFFYPSQPASMIDLNLTRDGDGRVIFQSPVQADDDSLDLGTLPTGYSFATPVTPQSRSSASRGKYGLGESYAFTTSVRPFRLVFESTTQFCLDEPSSP